MLTPQARGTLSSAAFAAMRTPGADLASLRHVGADSHDDAQITLWALYEMHYRGLDDVDAGLEWHPDLLAVRHRLERDLEALLTERFDASGWQAPDPADFAQALFDFVEHHEGPSLAQYCQRQASAEEVLELLRLRTIYHLKEADATAWVVPRLDVRPKAALMELQFDEYGGGRPARLHSHLFAQGLESVGLSAEYGAYIDEVPAPVLEQNNAMSLFGLHRRLRGAALGHLAAFEMCSSVPSRRMAGGLERLGLGEGLVAYYLEHVEADAVHEQLAVRSICGALVEDEPEQLESVFLGAFTCMDLEDRLAHHLMGGWQWARSNPVEVPA